MRKSTSIFVAGILLGALLTAGGFAFFLRGQKTTSEPERGNVKVLKLAHVLELTHPVHQAIEYMRERLEAASGGRMTLDIYPSGVLGGETQCLEQVQNGVLAMTKTSASPIEGFVEEMQVFGLPYLFRDAEHVWKVLNGAIGRELLHKGRAKNLYGLCYYDAGSRNFYNNKRQIKSPDDLKGLKIRVQNSPVAIKMVEAMGGAPTPIAWGELYTALAQGTVDGAENNPPSFVSNKHYETCKFFSLDAHTQVPDILLISTQVWESLTAREQEWLQKAADESSTFQRQLWAKRTEENLDEARKLGVDIYTPDKKPFMDKVQPVYDAFKGTAVEKLVERIRAVK